MNLDEAREMVDGIGAWVDWEALEEGSPDVMIDGLFTLPQLQALAVVWAEAQEKVIARGRG